MLKNNPSRIFITLALLTALGPLASAQDESEPASKPWITISSPAGFATVSTGGNWSLKDGVISLTPRAGESGWQRFGSYLWLGKDYSNFECSFDYRHEAGGNSGFYFRVADPKDPVKTGVELQLLDCHAKPRLGWHDLGGLIKFTKEGHKKPLKKATKPAGEWNTVLISLKNHHLSISINGITVQDHPFDPELPRNGKIGFQDHGLPFHIRNFKIRSAAADAR
ncbi:MAG: 3-keto-disaccharide hydrolase [Akkermansiaceae bacterium]